MRMKMRMSKVMIYVDKLNHFNYNDAK
jgi:hypothetical protein